MILRFVARLLALVVLVVSGAYLLIYLYRWEWNRAIISGIFFLAAELGLATALLVGRLQDLARRVARLDDPIEQRLRVQLGESNARPSRAFGWLRETTTRTNVFVPVLLGSGVLLAAIAFVVERFAMFVAGNTVDRQIARRLATLQPPPGGLLDPIIEEDRPEPMSSRSRRTAVAVVALALLAWLSIDLIGDATQSRPERLAGDAVSTIDLRIDERGIQHPAVDTAAALWTTCRVRLPPGTSLTELTPLDDRHVRVVVEPGLGDLRLRRFVGCLEDATLNLVQATVIAQETGPPTPEPN